MVNAAAGGAAFDEAVRPAACRVASFSWQLGAHPLSSCSHSITADNDNNNNHNRKRHNSLVRFVHSLHCIYPPPHPLQLPLFPKSSLDWSQHNQPISESTTECVQVSRGSAAKFGAFHSGAFFPFFFFFFSACRKACAAARCLCWMQETDALQEIWKQTGSPLSSGLLFSYTSLPPSSHPVQIRLHSD